MNTTDIILMMIFVFMVTQTCCLVVIGTHVEKILRYIRVIFLNERCDND